MTTRATVEPSRADHTIRVHIPNMTLTIAECDTLINQLIDAMHDAKSSCVEAVDLAELKKDTP